jgi:PAS domain S-box-containing protein
MNYNKNFNQLFNNNLQCDKAININQIIPCDHPFLSLANVKTEPNSFQYKVFIREQNSWYKSEVYEYKTTAGSQRLYILILFALDESSQHNNNHIEELEKYKKAFDASPDALSIYNVTTDKVVDVNATFEKTYGYSKKELLGSSLKETEMWGNPHERDLYLSQVCNKGEIRNFETTIINSKKKYNQHQISAKIFNVSHKSYALMTCRNVEFEKQKENLLFFISHKEWTEISNNIFDGMTRFLTILFQAEGVVISKIINGNDKIETISIYCHNNYLANITFPDELSSLKIINQSHFISTSPTTAEDDLRNLTNYTFTQSHLSYLLSNHNHEPIGILSVLNNKPSENEEHIKELVKIAAKPLADKILKNNNDTNIRKKNIKIQAGNKAFETIWVLDSDLNIIYLSSSVESLIGHLPLFGITTSITEVLSKQSATQLANLISIKREQLKQKNTTTLSEVSKLELIHKNGTSIIIDVSIIIMTKGNTIHNIIVSTQNNIRKDSDNQLYENEKKFKQIFDKHTIVMLLIEPDTGQIIDANQAASDFYKYPVDQLREMNIGQISRLPGLLVHEMRYRALTHKQNYFVFPHQIASGEIKTVEVHSSPIEIGGRQLLFSIIHDITSSIHTESLRVELETKYHQLFANLTSGFAIHEIICDDNDLPVDYKYIEVNPAFEKILGKERTEIIGKTARELFPDIEAFWINTFGQVALTGQTQYFENYFQALKSYFGVLAFSPVKKQFASITHNITEYKIKERKLREHEEQLRTIFEHTHSVLLLINPNCEIIRINHAGLELSDRTNIELTNQQPGNVLKCIHSFQDERGCGYSQNCNNCSVRKIIGKTLNENIEFSNEEVEFQQETSKGIINRHLNISASLIHISEQKHVLITIEDITQRKKMENELLIAKLKAEESDKLKTAFFNNLSHEIRTPLNGIMGFTGLLKKCEDSSMEMALYASYIQENSSRLLVIMNNVIELAQINSGLFTIRHTNINLTELAEKVIEEQSIYNKMNIPINVIIKGFTHVKSDPKIIQSILEQLINNSIKFTYEGHIEVRINTHLYELTGLIADTGIGIAKGDQQTIFNPFKQVEDTMTRNYGGVGLGLAIIKGYVDKLGGSLKIKSQTHKGTAIKFNIPILAIPDTNKVLPLNHNEFLS